MKPQQHLRKKNNTSWKMYALASFSFTGILIGILMGILTDVMLPIASAEEHCPHHSQEKPDTLYEMVPHIVLPKTIQYKAKPVSYHRPWEYVSYTDFPATYTAFPSYVLPYPTEMRSIQQTIYPIIPNRSESEVANVQQMPYYVPMQTMMLPATQMQMIPLASNANGFRPILILAVPPVQDQEKPNESEKNRPLPAIPEGIQKPQTEDELLTNAQRVGIQQVQWANPMPLPPSSPQQNSNSSCETNALDPAKPLQPTPDTAGLAYAGYPNPQYSAYAQPYAQQANPNGEQSEDAAYQNSLGASGLNQDVLKRIEEMIRENPNIQFSAVMMGPNGQLVPIGGTQNPGQFGMQQLGAGQQPGGMQMTAEQRTQLLQSQLQYIQAMNQYAQQAYAQRAARYAQFHGTPQSMQYQSPFAANPYAATPYGNPYAANPYSNPYAAAQSQNGVAAGNGNDSCSSNSQQQAVQQQTAQQQAMMQQQQMMMQQQQQQMMQQPYLYNPYYAGYGAVPMGQYGSPYVLVNPYYPMQQQASGDQNSNSGKGRRDRERNLVERFREQRKAQEKKMCEAWRSPHYAEDTGMRFPAKEAYPWGYFGSQVGPQATPNFGGYQGMYYGNSTYPGN